MDKSMMAIPWLLAVATAIWFGFTAHRAERNSVLWSLGGGLFALVISTIVLGLGNAAAMPFSDHERSSLHLRWTGEAVVLIGILGWLFTLGLHRQDGRFLSQDKTATPASQQTANRPGGTIEMPKAPPPPPKGSCKN